MVMSIEVVACPLEKSPGDFVSSFPRSGVRWALGGTCDYPQMTRSSLAACMRSQLYDSNAEALVLMELVGRGRLVQESRIDRRSKNGCF
jgi:hypothetical protein